MRKSSFQLSKKIIAMNFGYLYSQNNKSFFIKNVYPSSSVYLQNNLYTNKIIFAFSQQNKKPTQSNRNLQSQQENIQYSSKHKQKQEDSQYSQKAQMTPDGQKPGDSQQSPFVPTSFGNYFIGISCVCLILAYAVMEVQFMRAANNKKSPAQGAKKVISKGKAHIGGDWQLIGTDGKKLSSKDFQGKYYLIYFGFCNCPDICPNSLMKLAKAIQRVKKTTQAKFFNLQSVFVSVDPDRDSLQKIEKFAKLFDKDMIGVTGLSNDDPALKQCMKKFKIYSSKIEFEDEQSVIKGRKSYTIDHTILTYLMSPSNQYVAHIGANLGQHDMAKLILQKIKQNQRESMQKLKV